jgi:hypothetical protein
MLLERDVAPERPPVPYLPTCGIVLLPGWRTHFGELDKLVDVDAQKLVELFFPPPHRPKRKRPVVADRTPAASSAAASSAAADDDEVEFVCEETVDDRNARGFDASTNPELIEL